MRDGSRREEGTESGGVVCDYYTALNGENVGVKNVILKYISWC